MKKLSKPTSLIDDKADWNGELCPFRGTSELYGENTEETASDFDDSEWLDESINQSVENPKINNALGDLMSAYNSDEEFEDEVTSEQKIVESNKEEASKDADNDDAPIEIKIKRELDEQCSSTISKSPECEQKEASNKNKKKRKKCKHPKNDVSSKRIKLEESPRNVKEKNYLNQSFRKRKVTLLERLLDSEIRHERNVLLQCVRYVVENDYFKQK